MRLPIIEDEKLMEHVYKKLDERINKILNY